MATLARKLRNILPAAPRKRYNIFAGTNTFEEWLSILKARLRYEPRDYEAEISAYEKEFAAAVGVDHAISFAAGRMAFYAILEAMNIGPGDEVILPAYTCVVVPNALLYRRARPVYVDIEPRTFNIDVNQVESVITPRTRALYAQHTFGVPCNLAVLQDIGARHGLPVIEDCGHALGAVIGGRSVGSFTEVSYFTTDHSKVMSTYLGGVAATNDLVLAQRIRAIQQRSPFLALNFHNRLLVSFLLEYLLGAPKFYWLGRPMINMLWHIGFLFAFKDELLTVLPEVYSYPCRFSSQQAMLGRTQLCHLPANLEHRRRIAAMLESHLGWYGMDKVEIAQSSWLRYSFLVKDRDSFEARFSKHFDLGIWFTSPVHGRNENLQSVGYTPGSCPVAERVSRHIANFPTHLRIPFKHLEREVAKHGPWIKSQFLFPRIGS